MSLDSELERIEKELSRYIEENEDIREERWHQQIVVARHHIRVALKLLG